MEERELTFGEQLVGVKFNPSGDKDVDRLKEIMAEAADIVERKQQESGKDAPYLANLIAGEALRRILGAQMWAVKYVTLDKK